MTTEAGETFKSKFVISGCGALREPMIPKFPGKELFRGPSFHSSQWDHTQDLRGKRVALIGSGASAAQIGPDIVDQVKSLHVFQRTPNWFFPKLNPNNPEALKWLYRTLPFTKHLMRAFMLICKHEIMQVIKTRLALFRCTQCTPKQSQTFRRDCPILSLFVLS